MFTNLRTRLFFYLGEFMPTSKTKGSKIKTSEKQKNLNEEKKMANLQRSVCRDILDAAEVTKSQVATEIVQGLANKMDQREIQELVRRISGTVDTQASQLVDRVVKATS